MARRVWFKRMWWPFTAVNLVVIMVQVGALAYMHVYKNTGVPKPRVLPQTTHIYDRDGGLIATFHGEVNRTHVPIAHVPGHLRDAVIAIEDADFYTEGGINPRAMLRAALTNLREGRITQGGSTITQQFVKNAITGSEKSYERKIKEAIIAEKLARRYTKDEILERYLNNVYFGHGAYGVAAAAETYFDVDVTHVSLEQAAMLAGLIAAPARFDPVDHPVRAQARRNTVLDRMVEQGYAKASTVVAIRNAPVETRPRDPHVDPDAAYFVDHVKRTLQEHYGSDDTFGGGLRVDTTFDPEFQEIAQRAVRRNLPGPSDPAAALIAIEPATGDIRAMVGGPGFDDSQYNLATIARRQTGSAFKTFALAAALENDVPLSSVWSGPSSIVIPDARCRGPRGEPWKVGNYSDSSAGTMSLDRALAFSVNTIFAQLALKVGPDAVVDVARRMGIASPLSPVCSVVLGTQTVTVLDMATAFATVAAEGVRRGPNAIASITGPSGDALYERDVDGERAIAPGVARQLTRAMQGVVEYGTGVAAGFGRDAAGKTGTAQNWQDAWFCGFVPQLVACVWVGYPEGAIPMRYVQGVDHVVGGSIPAAIWRDFMARAMKGRPKIPFVEPTPSPAGSVPGYAPTYPTTPITPAPAPTESAPAPAPEPTSAPAPSEPPSSPGPLPLPDP